jgi:chloramphenicol 3-O phosphotransferase
MHLLLSLLSVFVSFSILFADELTPPYGTIILLNGPSAIGKSSIQNEIQKQFPELYLRMGLDNLFEDLIPIPDLSSFEKKKEFSQYTNEGVLIRRVSLNKDAQGHQVVNLELGPAGDKIFSGMHYAIAAYSDRGNNVVVDYVMFKPVWLRDLVAALKGHKVYLIGLNAPLDVLEKREKDRGTSPIGHARSHYATVHEGFLYDLELDVANSTPMQSALKIKEFIQKNPHPTALNRLVDIFSEKIKQPFVEKVR